MYVYIYSGTYTHPSPQHMLNKKKLLTSIVTIGKDTESTYTAIINHNCYITTESLSGAASPEIFSDLAALKESFAVTK